MLGVSFPVWQMINSEETYLCESNTDFVGILKGLNNLGNADDGIFAEYATRRTVKPVLGKHARPWVIKVMLFFWNPEIFNYYQTYFVSNFLKQNKTIASQCPNRETEKIVSQCLRHLSSRFPQQTSFNIEMKEYIRNVVKTKAYAPVNTLEDAFNGIKSINQTRSHRSAKFIALSWELAVHHPQFNELILEDIVKVLSQNSFQCASEDDICRGVVAWAKSRSDLGSLRKIFNSQLEDSSTKLIDLIHFEKLSSDYFLEEIFEEMLEPDALKFWQRMKHLSQGREYSAKPATNV